MTIGATVESLSLVLCAVLGTACSGGVALNARCDRSREREAQPIVRYLGRTMQGFIFVLFCALLAACGSSSDTTSQEHASCASNNGGCDPHATCSDPAGGGVMCTCEPGYAGDGHTCTNVAGSLQGLRWELPCA